MCESHRPHPPAMRLLLLALAVTLTAGYSTRPVAQFIPRQTYHYKYEVKMELRKDRELPLATAGVKIKADVYLSSPVNDSLVMRFHNTSIYEFNDYSGTEWIRADQLSQDLASEFEKTIKFDYKYGKVDNIRVLATSSVFVNNIKKAMVNILHLTLKDQDRYSLQEVGSQGTCLTSYMLLKSEANKDIKVTKTKNLRDCVNPVIKNSGLAYTESCPQCVPTIKSISGFDSYRYFLKHVDSGYAIQGIDSDEQLLFNPFFDTKGGTIMDSKQQLVFIESKDGQILPSPGLYEKVDPEYKFVDEGDYFPFMLRDLDTAEAQAIKILELLANNNNISVDPNAPLQFAELARLLRASPRDLMESLWTKYSHLSTYRRVLRDVIPHNPKLQSLKFIKEKFVDGNLTASEAAQMFLVSLQALEVDKWQDLMIAKSLLEEPKIIEHHLVRKVSTLGVGSLINRWCKSRNSSSAFIVLNELHEMLNKAIIVSDSDTIILTIKALANAGQPSSVRVIQRLLPGYGHICGILEPQVIIDAILALRRFAKVAPNEIKSISLKLLFNKQLVPEIRTAAMIALFDTNPEFNLVVNVASYLNHERNFQVVHFGYTLMKSLSMSTVPDRHVLAQSCKHGLGILNRPFPKISVDVLSMAYSRSLYSLASKLGGAFFDYGLRNELSPVPKNAITRLETLLGGLRTTPIEVGGRTNALLESMLKVTDGSATRAEKMIKIARILSSVDPQVTRQLRSQLYIAPFDQQVLYFDPLETVVELATQRPSRDLIQEALQKISEGVSVSTFKGLMPIDTTYSMPTSIGLPLTISTLTTGVSSAYLRMRGGVTPPLSDDSQSQQLRNSNISIKAEARLSSELKSIFAVGLSTRYLQARLQTELDVSVDFPVSLEVTIDMSKKKLSIKVKDVGQTQLMSVATKTWSLTQTITDAHPLKKALIPSHHRPPVSAPPAKDTYGSFESIFTADIPHEAKNHETIPDMKTGVFKLMEVPGGILTVSYYTQSTSSDKHCRSCIFCGTHGFLLNIEHVADRIREIELSIAVGHEAENIMTMFKDIEEKETLEDTNMLKKLQKILTPGRKNQTFSSSSSESFSGEASRSSMSQSSSSSESSESSSSSSSTESGRQILPETDTINFIPNQHGIQETSFKTVTPESEAPVLSVSLKVFRDSGSVSVLGGTLYSGPGSFRITLKVVTPDIRWDMNMAVHQIKDQIQLEVKWGTEAQRYQFGVTSVEGQVEDKPAHHIVITWKNVPRAFSEIAQKITDFVSKEASHLGWTFDRTPSRPKIITIVAIMVSVDEMTVKCVTPSWRLVIPVIDIPAYKLIRDAYQELTTAEGNLGNTMLHAISNANAAKCTVVQDTVVTFNKRQFKSEMPHICSQVLAQDCTTERKFLVQLKKDLILNQNDINVLVADIDVSIHQRDNAIGVTVNGIEIPVSNLPYQHPTGTIRIAQKDQGIALFAARHGLSEVFLDLGGVQIRIPDWMRGQTCGMCGRGDGEYLEEFHTPNRRLATTALSFAQSWVVPGTGCNDISKCYLATKSVKLDRQITLNGQESKCYSVEPVLRCQPGCTPVRTTSVQVGYHCVPAEASVNRAQSSMFKKSVDVTETAVAHLACRCNPQCA